MAAKSGGGREAGFRRRAAGGQGEGDRPAPARRTGDARRLLRRKLQWAKHAEDLRCDPDALLVLVAELYAELARLRKEASTLRQAAQRSSDRPV